MSRVLLKQKRPQQATISGYALLFLTPVLWYYDENTIDKIVLLLLIGLVLIGYSVTYEIRREFDNYRRIKPIWHHDLEGKIERVVSRVYLHFFRIL
jgi:hypothetical protein